MSYFNGQMDSWYQSVDTYDYVKEIRNISIYLYYGSFKINFNFCIAMYFNFKNITFNIFILPIKTLIKFG